MMTVSINSKFWNVDTVCIMTYPKSQYTSHPFEVFKCCSHLHMEPEICHHHASRCLTPGGARPSAGMVTTEQFALKFLCLSMILYYIP